MAVLVEGISVIVKLESIESKYPRGWTQFKADVPNQTLCCDSELVRVGFMSPEDVQRYVRKLEEKCLVFQRDGKTVDIAVADQQRGFTVTCDWAEYGHLDWNGDSQKRIAACRLVGSKENRVFTPEGWVFENSLSCKFQFIPTEDIEKEMEFIGWEGAVKVYRDRKTG